MEASSLLRGFSISPGPQTLMTYYSTCNSWGLGVYGLGPQNRCIPNVFPTKEPEGVSSRYWGIKLGAASSWQDGTEYRDGFGPRWLHLHILSHQSTVTVFSRVFNLFNIFSNLLQVSVCKSLATCLFCPLKLLLFFLMLSYMELVLNVLWGFL